MRRMFFIIFAFILVKACCTVHTVPIVNNNGATGEDSLTFNILNLLPSGNPADKLDSSYLTVYKSHTNDVVFRDSAVGAAMTGVDSFIIGGDAVYYFHRAVSDIDGSGGHGVYSYSFTAVHSDSGMRTQTIGQFQVTGWELDDIGDSSGLAAINSDNALDSLHLIIDSLTAALDTLQNQDDWVSSFDSRTDVVVTSDTTSTGRGLVTYSGGSDSTMLLKRLAIIGANSTSASLYVENSSDNSPAVFFDADGSGAATTGLRIDGNAGCGMYITGNAMDIALEGSGAVHGAVDSVRYVSIEAADTIANRVLEDSASYHGDASGLTAGDIWTYNERTILGGWIDSNKTEQGGDSTLLARSVWNTPQDNHSLPGTFGKYLDTEISGIGSGSGLYAYTLMVIDSGIGQIVPGVSLSVRNIEQSGLIATGRTDAAGIVNFNLDADSFIVIPFSPGYIFESYDTLLVSGTGIDSVFGYRFDPGEPSDPDLCRVYGFVYDIEGNPESDAVVTAWLPAGVTRAGTGIISPLQIETTTDESGYFYLDLIPGPQLLPDTAEYEISITLSNGTILRERVVVPDQGSWILAW